MHLFYISASNSYPQAAQHTSVADASVEDLNADFVGFGRSNLDVFDGKVFAGLPGNGSLQSNQRLIRGGRSPKALEGIYLAGDGLVHTVVSVALRLSQWDDALTFPAVEAGIVKNLSVRKLIFN